MIPIRAIPQQTHIDVLLSDILTGDSDERDKAVNNLASLLRSKRDVKIEQIDLDISRILILVLESSKDDSTRQNSLLILGELAIQPQNKNKLVDLLTPSLLSLLGHSDPITEENILTVLVYLLRDSDHFLQKRFFLLNPVPNLSLFLSKPHQSTSVSINYCVEIFEIIMNSRAVGKKRVVYEANVTPALIHLLISRDDRATEKRICSILYSLSVSLELRHHFLNQELSDQLITYALKGVGQNYETDIIANIIGTLRNVATVPSNIQLLVEGEILSLIGKVLERITKDPDAKFGLLIERLMDLISTLAADPSVKEDIRIRNGFLVQQLLSSSNIDFSSKFNAALALVILQLPTLKRETWLLLGVGIVLCGYILRNVFTKDKEKRS